MTAPTLDRERLARVLGMLGSDHDGEVVAAARQAERLRREAGITWPDLISPALPQRHRREAATADLWGAIRFCAEHPGALNEWEINFLASLSRRRAPLSDKQSATLQRIVAKCRAAERAAA